MRLVVLSLFLSIGVTLANDTYAQSTQITISVQNEAIAGILESVEQQSDFTFIYDSKAVDTKRKVSVQANQKNIFDVLNQMFAGSDIAYTVINKKIILTKENEIIALQQKQQGITITGTVSDAEGQPLPGASVVIKGTTLGTVTDANGAYSTNVPNTNVTLVFSFVGYASQEFLVGDRRDISVTMSEVTSEFEEVVVVGYGTQKKGNLTGSVVQVSGAVLKQSPAANLSNSLVGRLPGVIANNRSGEPGSDYSDIFIRGKSTLGNNSPLWVIDGVAGVGNIERLNPSDIESVSVLKDASAAIYGAQAANGVILITTRRGNYTAKPVITYEGNFGISQNTRTPQLMNSYQYMVYDDEVNAFFGRTEVSMVR